MQDAAGAGSRVPGRAAQVTALNAVKARMPMIAKMTRKTKNRTLAISAAPVAIPVKPSRPAMAARIAKNKAHLSRDIESLLTKRKRHGERLSPQRDSEAASGRSAERSASLTPELVLQIRCHHHAQGAVRPPATRGPDAPAIVA